MDIDKDDIEWMITLAVTIYGIKKHGKEPPNKQKKPKKRKRRKRK